MISANTQTPLRKAPSQSGKGGLGGLIALMLLVGIPAAFIWYEKNKPENIKAAFVQSGFGFGKYYMKFEKIAEFNMAEAVSSGVERAFGISIPPSVIKQIGPKYLGTTAVLAKLISCGDAIGRPDTSSFILLREKYVPKGQYFVIRDGLTVGWISKPTYEGRIDYDEGTFGVPDHVKNRPIIIEIMVWEGDWVVID